MRRVDLDVEGKKFRHGVEAALLMSGLERAPRAFAILVLARTRRRTCGSARSPTSTTLEGLRGMKGERQVGARLELRARVECCEVVACGVGRGE